jgi:DNA-binding NarL/FixJ family response regulator
MSITVFLADDHAVVRDGLQSMLEAQGDIEVIGHAGNGYEAVDKITELCPDVAVVDIAMPEMNGIDVTREVIKACPSTRVVILSMYSTTEHILQALQAGALGYVLKESAGVEVIGAVRAVHAGHRYLSEKILDRVVTDYVSWSATVKVKSPLERLTPREREVLQFVVESKSSVEISQILEISPKTIDTHRSRLMKKLDIKNLGDLIKFGLRQGITPPEEPDSTFPDSTSPDTTA